MSRRGLAAEGRQLLYRYANGYGASVVQHTFSLGGSQGQWELAVVRWEGDSHAVDYDTPITDSALGYLDEADVDDLLVQIEALPAPAQAGGAL